MGKVGSRRAGRAALENHMACDLEAEGTRMDMDMGIGFAVVGIGLPEEEGLKLTQLSPTLTFPKKKYRACEAS